MSLHGLIGKDMPKVFFINHFQNLTNKAVLSGLELLNM